MRVQNSSQILMEVAPYTDRSSLNSLADKSKVPRQTLRNWRNGFTEARLDLLLKTLNSAGYRLELVKND